MARASSVEYEQVAKACSTLFMNGRNTSFDAVYEEIGRRGSAKVVQEYISDWRQEIAGRFVAGRTNPDLPEELVTESDRLLVAVWQLALGKADTAYAGAREQLAAAQRDMETKIAFAQERAGEFERETLTLKERLRGLESQLSERNQSIEAMRQEQTETTTLLRTKAEENGTLREEISRLNAILEAERTSHDAALAAERRQHDEALARERERHESAIALERRRASEEIEREREVAAGDRRHLMEQTDQIRQAARITQTALSGQLEEARTIADAFRQKAGNAEAQIAYQRGRAETAETELGKTKELLGLLQGEVAVLRSQLQLAEEAKGIST